MEILYLGSFFPENQKKEIYLNSKDVIQNAGDTFQKSIVNGLMQYEECRDLKIMVSPMLGSFPFRYKKLFYKGCVFEHNIIKNCTSYNFVNLSLYKNLSRYKSIIKDLKVWANKDSYKKYIIIFSLDISLIKAAYEIKKDHKNIHLSVIITDLIEFMVTPSNFMYKTILSYQDEKIKRYLKLFDSFIFLTEYMKDKLNVGERPYIILEGVYDNTIKTKNFNKEHTKTILYTGTLAKIYGILHLVNAFSMINDENYRLWICGDGDAKKDIIEKCKKDKRIIYFGQLEKEEILALQKKATVLINPRFSTDEYTKYSFPSKTMEYLASGTPVIMHPLKCIPKEYLDKIYIAYDETDEGLKNKIVEICEKSHEELNAFGNKASEFIHNEKNSFIQAGKILNLLKNEK